MKKRWWELIIVLVIIGFVYLTLKDIDFNEVFSILSQANFFWLFFALISFFLGFVSLAYRYNLIIKPFLKTKIMFLLSALFSASFINAITPFGGAIGEPVKSYIIHKRYKKDFNKIFSYVLSDGFFNMAILFVLAFLSMFFRNYRFKPNDNRDYNNCVSNSLSNFSNAIFREISPHPLPYFQTSSLFTLYKKEI